MDSAWIGAAGVLLGGVASSLLTMRADSERWKRQAADNAQQRTHEFEMRKLELQDEHRGRLHAERRTAYTDFSLCYRRYELAGKALVRAMTALEQRPDDAESNSAYVGAFNELVVATEALNDNLVRVEVVASTPVEQAARDLRFHSQSLGVVGDQISDEMKENESKRLYQIELRQIALRQAIRTELELDR